MDIQPVLMQLLESGQPAGELLARGLTADALAADAGGRPFALVLAHEAAPALAAATARPVLILPDGGLVLEFDAAHIPPGGVIVSPCGSQARYSVTGEYEPVPEAEAAQEASGAGPPMELVSPGVGPPEPPRTRAVYSAESGDDATGSEPVAVPLRSSAAYRVAGSTSESSPAQVRSHTLTDAAEPKPPVSAEPLVFGKAGSLPADEAQSVSTTVPSSVKYDAESVALAVPQSAGRAPEQLSGAIGGPVKQTAEPLLVPFAARGLAEAVPAESILARPAPSGMDAPAAGETAAALTQKGLKAEMHVLSADCATAGAAARNLEEAVAAGLFARPEKSAMPAARGVQSLEEPLSAPVDTQSAAKPVSAPADMESAQKWDMFHGGGESETRHPLEAETEALPGSKSGEMTARFTAAARALSDVATPESAAESARGPLRTVPNERVPGLEPGLPTFDAVESTSQPRGADAAMEHHLPRGAAFQDSMTELAVKSVRYLVSEGEKTLRVRLVPESLGEVRVEIVSTRDELHLRLVSGNPAVREALESGSEGLRNALARDGVHLVRVTVSADGGAHDSQGGLSGRGSWSDNHHSPRHSGSWPDSGAQGWTVTERRAERGAHHEGSLSVYV